MSVYVTGDCHGGFQRFTTKNFPVIDGCLVVRWERISKIEVEV